MSAQRILPLLCLAAPVSCAGPQEDARPLAERSLHGIAVSRRPDAGFRWQLSGRKATPSFRV